MKVYFLFALFFLYATSVSAQNQDVIKKRFGKYGIKQNGKWIVRPRYDSVHLFVENRAAVMKKGKWGFVDDKGKKIVRRQYEKVEDFNGGLAGVKDGWNKKWCIIDKNGKEFYGREYFDTVVYVDSFALGRSQYFFKGADTVYSVFHVGKNSPCAENVDSMLRCENKYLLFVSDNFCRFGESINCEIMSNDGQRVTSEFIYDKSLSKKTVIVSSCDDKMAAVSPNLSMSNWYYKIIPDSNGFSMVESDYAHCGLINSCFKEIISPIHKNIRFAGKDFIVEDESGFSLYDSTGTKLTLDYNKMNYIGCGMFRVKDSNESTWELINAEGRIFPDKYDSICSYNNSVARVISFDRKQFAYVDKEGKIISKWYDCGVTWITYSSGDDIIPRIFFGIITLGISELFYANHENSDEGPSGRIDTYYGNDFRNGYSVYTAARKAPSPNPHGEKPVYIGIIDSTGKEIIKAEYLSVVMEDTFFVFEKSSGSGLMSYHGTVILPAKYGSIYSLGNNFFEVSQNGGEQSRALVHIENMQAHFLTSFRFESIDYGGDSAFIVKDFPYYGYISSSGKSITPIKYGQAKPFKDGKAEVSYEYSNGEFYIDRKGKKIE